MYRLYPHASYLYIPQKKMCIIQETPSVVKLLEDSRANLNTLIVTNLAHESIQRAGHP